MSSSTPTNKNGQPVTMEESSHQGNLMFPSECPGLADCGAGQDFTAQKSSNQWDVMSSSESRCGEKCEIFEGFTREDQEKELSTMRAWANADLEQGTLVDSDSESEGNSRSIKPVTQRSTTFVSICGKIAFWIEVILTIIGMILTFYIYGIKPDDNVCQSPVKLFILDVVNVLAPYRMVSLFLEAVARNSRSSEALKTSVGIGSRVITYLFFATAVDSKGFASLLCSAPWNRPESS
ncbi:hypothetical protein VTL71DRAFT_10395 [Oculimacula yallundae]|uniref:Uncharacterized protein n=1 Tax=Oculimacula yallundae TaxID=86028 RepID=A0ABR4CUF0_9HELO